MFSVLFEVHPRPDQWDAYLGQARMLRLELERIDGFVDNLRYRSLTREGWILSLSGWRDEKALVRWRVQAVHHRAQEKGRSEILLDYHLRVGQLTRDTPLPEGCALHEQRLDETEAGTATTVTLDRREANAGGLKATSAQGCADALGLDRSAPAGRVGRVRRRTDAGRCDRPRIVARTRCRRRVRSQGHAARRRAPSKRARGARLRHVRSARGAAVLP